MSIFYEGMIVERKKAGIITHPGIIVKHENKWMVIHNTPFASGVIISSIEEYADGYDIIISKRYNPSIPLFEVAQNARSALGQKWNLLFNCQHFVTWASGHKPHSPDLNTACLLSLGVLFCLSLKR